ncbi:MAG: 4-hydroxy-tetrahydrodipicolinate synthase [Candidatus Sumerlaeia bacterium]|nr:4-hydroxy-tetrahydrodipicolinate synthase [Candidatus Sumerlaeia bacterium]
MMNSSQLRGCYPAMITPMKNENGEIVIDKESFKQLVKKVCDAGVSGILIAGTTGQSATLDTNEQVNLINEMAAFTRDYSRKIGRSIQIIGSASSNSTAEAINLTRNIVAARHLDAVLHLTGYYNNPPQAGLYKHFKAVADVAAEAGAATILYNVPSRTASNISPETAIRLADHPGIIGIKEASGNIDQIQTIIDGTRSKDFVVVSGEDHMVAEIIQRGGTGVISASANRWPREFQVLCELALEGKHQEAAQLQVALQPCVDAVFSAKNPIPLHHIFGSEIRLPLVTLSEFPLNERLVALEKINRAIAIREFPHVEPLVLAGAGR